jgi:1,4-alpha-glucan branching enzyme
MPVAYPTAHPQAIHALLGGHHGAPFDLLGLHPLTFAAAEEGQPPQAAVVVRTYQPHAARVTLLRDGQSFPMVLAHPDGFFEYVFEGETGYFVYQLRVEPHNGDPSTIDDPYRFGPVLSEFDLHLFNEGNHFQLYDKLGAHVVTHGQVPGALFCVWAPSAERVSVVGDFNQWDGRRHPMRPRGSSGLWELFIPALQPGDLYKYEIKTRYKGYVATKSDPYGFAMETRPKTASIIWDLEQYAWHDAAWMTKRKEQQGLDKPMSVYEVHLGSWQRHPEGNQWLTYRELADRLIPYAQEMGYTHLELLPVSEHPYDGSWGYQTIGYFAPTARFGTPDDFRYFVDVAHQAGIGIILDWVPAHFPRDATGLAFFDGTHLYEHADPRKGAHMDWGTLIFNYGRNEVAAFLLTNALFWLDKYHIDGLRVDAVASMLYLDYSRKPGEWIRNEFGGRENLEAVRFLKRFNELVHLQFPGVLTIAEESTAWPMVSRPTYLGGLGFDLKWNMGWMHDMLKYMQTDPLYRRYQQTQITFSMMYAFTENFVLPFSHDEVVHGKGSMIGKMPGDYWQKFANLRALYGYMFAHPGKKTHFMSNDLGQFAEWNHDKALDWHLLEYPQHAQLHQYVRDLNHLYQAEPALHEVDFHWEGFQWIDFRDMDHSIVSFVRRAKDPDNFVLVVANFTPVARKGYRVGVPEPGFYRELLNTDAEAYGGTNAGNGGGVASEPILWQDQPHSLALTLPPLSVLYLKTNVPPKPKPVAPPAPAPAPEEVEEEEQPSVPVNPLLG